MTGSCAVRRREFALYFQRHLADDDAQAVREAFCREIARTMEQAGCLLNLDGFVSNEETVRVLGTVVRMGAALGRGATDLLAADNAYAAASLTRQVVEVEYLLWTFADDISEASRWLYASRSQMQKRFRPSVMRRRSGGRFRSDEYRKHCERGGHPHPDGRALLGEIPCPDPVRAMWVDLGQHLERAWDLFVEAATAAGSGGLLDSFEIAVERRRQAWHRCDPLAQRLARLPDED